MDDKKKFNGYDCPAFVPTNRLIFYGITQTAARCAQDFIQAGDPGARPAAAKTLCPFYELLRNAPREGAQFFGYPGDRGMAGDRSMSDVRTDTAVSEGTLRRIVEQGFFGFRGSLADARAACAELIFARELIKAQTIRIAQLDFEP
jgi:hypothetical protein